MLLYYLFIFLIYFFKKIKCDCDFRHHPNNLTIYNKYMNTQNNVQLNNHIKYCIERVKSLKTLKFVCPKNGKDYEGIELRPLKCFEEVRVEGRNINLNSKLKIISIESSDTDDAYIREVTIVPTNINGFYFECTCDNSLTFNSNGENGYRGIMRVFVRKTVIYGCDFDNISNTSKNNSFASFYNKNDIDPNKGIVCIVNVEESKVNFGLICPDGYDIYPNNCFQQVIQNNLVVLLKNIIKGTEINIYNDKKMAFAYYELQHNEGVEFSCKCKKANDESLIMILKINSVESNSIVHKLYFIIIIWLLFLFSI